MSIDDAVRRHRLELQQKHPVYQVFDLLEAVTAAPEALAALHRPCAGLAEAVISQELQAGPAMLETARAVLRQSPEDALVALSAWRATVDAAYPKRAGMQLVLDEFGRCLERLSPTARGPFLEALPRLCPVAHELKAAGLQALVDAANAMPSSEECRALLAFAAGYGETTGEILLAALEVGRRAIGWAAPELISRLAAVLTVEKLLESADAEKLLPALGHLSAQCAAIGEGHWRPALTLAVTVAESNLSSAYAVARDIPKRLPRLAAPAQQAWLEDFARLVVSIGTRVVGFGTKELPGLYESAGLDRARAFTAAAAQAGERYGATAGQLFLERKTAAAKALLQN